MKRKRIPRISAKQLQKTTAMLLAHRIDCDGLINDLVDKGLAYFDDDKKPHWTLKGKECWLNFYADLATMHDSWQCLAFASVLTDIAAAATFETAHTGKAKGERPGNSVDSSDA